MDTKTGQALFLVVVLSGTALTPLASATSGGAPVSEKTVTGAAIPLPADTEQSYLKELEEYTDTLPVSPKENAFLLMTEERTWVVATNGEPKAGIATVEGTAITSPTDDDSSLGVLFADEVSVRTTGEPATVADVRNNPGQYAFELVKIDANYRQLAYSIDSSDSVEPTQTTTGVITTGDFFGNFVESSPGETARWSTLNLSSEEYGGSRSAEETSRLLSSGDQLLVHSWSQDFSMNGPTTVTALVLTRTPGSMPESASETDEPLLYLVDANPNAEQLSGVQAIHERGDDLVGETVTVDAQAVGTRTSSKEFLLSVAECAPESVTVPVSPGCVPVVTDSAVHSGVLYSEKPASSTDFVGFVGLSNHIQERVTEPIHGEYQVTGRVVASSQIDPSLPEGYVLVVYSMEQQGSLSISPTDEVTGFQQKVESAVQRQTEGVEPATTTTSERTEQLDAEKDTSAQSDTDKGTTVTTAPASQSPTVTETTEMAVATETEDSQSEVEQAEPTTGTDGFGEIEAPVPGFGIGSSLVAFLLVAFAVGRARS